MHRIAILVAAAALSGCALAGKSVADRVADGVQVYCAEPEPARDFYRTLVNDALARYGHALCVRCAGDVDDCGTK